MKLNIAIPAPKQLADQAILLSQALERYGSAFTLDGVDFIPHLTLYMSDFEEGKILDLAKSLSEIADNVRGLELKAEKYFINDQLYIDIQYFKSGELLDLHHKVIEKLSGKRLIQELGPNRYSGDDSEKMYQNLKDFGYSIGKDLYRPHVSLTKLNQDIPEALESLNWDDFNFSPQQIGIFEADDSGCCRRKLYTFDLKYNL